MNKLKDKNRIVELYLVDKLNPRDIARKYDCAYTTIYNVLNGIKKHRFKGKPYQGRLNIPEKEIVKLYKNNFSAHEIARIFNCNHWCIYKILRKHNLKILGRGASYKERYTKEKYDKIVGANILRSKERGLKLKGKTYEEIYGEEKAKQIKKKLENNNSKYWKGKNRLDETIDKIKETHKGKHYSPKTEFGKAEKNPNWNGGSSFEPYDRDFNNKFKRAIRKRDNYICLKCGKHQEKQKKSLTVHHINYDKKLTISKNCISICNICHTETNYNRKHWIKFFQSLLSEKYGYLYDENQNIIINLEKIN